MNDQCRHPLPNHRCHGSGRLVTNTHTNCFLVVTVTIMILVTEIFGKRKKNENFFATLLESSKCQGNNDSVKELITFLMTITYHVNGILKLIKAEVQLPLPKICFLFLLEALSLDGLICSVNEGTIDLLKQYLSFCDNKVRSE